MMLKQGCIKVGLMLCSLLLVSCSSIPVSTMAKMSMMDEQDVIALNVEDLRIRTTLDKGVTLDTQESKFLMDVENRQGLQSYDFRAC